MNKALLTIAGLLIAIQLPAQAKLFKKDANGSTHVNLPFIHVDREFDSHGRKTVKVRAPFVKVDNPPGANNVHVSAPFTKVGHAQPGTTQVKAPFVKVNNPGGYHDAQVSAPFTKVNEHPNGTTSVKAPFTKVTEHPNGTTSVKAPFVKTTTEPQKTYTKTVTTRVQPTHK